MEKDVVTWPIFLSSELGMCQNGHDWHPARVERLSTVCTYCRERTVCTSTLREGMAVVGENTVVSRQQVVQKRTYHHLLGCLHTARVISGDEQVK